MAGTIYRRSVMAAAVVGIALSGCADFVKRAEFDSTVAELRATDQNLQSQIDALSQKYNALAVEVAGRVRVGTGARFATGDATLGEQDKPFLADFARILSGHSGAVVTVEGFADPLGSTGFNRKLGQRRADAVLEFLVSSGMNASQVRAVSYGEDENRQVRPGEVGEAGADNRRVSLVIDYAGAGAMAN